MLYKYDEEIEGEKRESFKLGQENVLERKQAQVETVRQKLANKRIETLGDKQLTLASEYYNEEELAKFKKPKKKIKKLRTKGKILTAEDLEQQLEKTGIEDIGTRRPKFKNEDFVIDDMPCKMNCFVSVKNLIWAFCFNVLAIEIPTDIKIEENDDELEKALHKARKAKQKDNAITDFIKTEIKGEPEEGNIDGGAIVLNSTAEFCRTLGMCFLKLYLQNFFIQVRFSSTQ